MKFFHFVYAFLQIGFLTFETYAKIVPLLYYMIVFMVAGQIFQVEWIAASVSSSKDSE